jgi:hypothetical protein
MYEPFINHYKNLGGDVKMGYDYDETVRLETSKHPKYRAKRAYYRAKNKYGYYRRGGYQYDRAAENLAMYGDPDYNAGTSSWIWVFAAVVILALVYFIGR